MHIPDSPLPAASAGERRALLSLSLAMLLSSLGTSIANVALPSLSSVFQASFQQVQWVVLSYLLAITTLIVSAGRLGDMLGRRQLLLGGVALFSLASLLCSTPSLPVLIAARAIQGAGAALMMALSLAYVAEIVPKARTGQAMGLLGTSSAIGTALGPSLGGLLLGSLGWQALFLVLVPLGGVTLLLLQRHLPASSQTARRAGGHDPLGTLLLALSLGCYALAMTSGHGSWSQTNSLLLALALLGGGLFLRSQQRAAAPLIRLSLLRQPPLLASLLMSGMVAAVVMATLVVGPFYLSRALALSNTQLGLVMSAGPLVAALGGVPSGRLVDRYGAGRMVLLGLLAMLAGSSGLAMLPLGMGSAGYIVAIVTLTAGYALFQAANNTGVMHGVAAEQRGLISGLLNLARNLGLITGAAVMGAVFAFASGSSAPAAGTAAASSSGLHLTFALAAVLIAIAMLLGRRLQTAPASN